MPSITSVNRIASMSFENMSLVDETISALPKQAESLATTLEGVRDRLMRSYSLAPNPETATVWAEIECALQEAQRLEFQVNWIKYI